MEIIAVYLQCLSKGAKPVAQVLILEGPEPSIDINWNYMGTKSIDYIRHIVGF